MKKVSKKWIQILLLYNLVFFGVTLFFYKIVPVILCYPPNSIDNSFQVAINGLTYSQQYLAIVISSLILENMILIFSLLKINTMRNRLKTCKKEEATKLYYSFSKSILKIPNIIYFIQVIIPIIMIAATFSMLKGDLFITLKVCVLYFAILALIASIAYIFSIKIFKQILVDIFYEIIDSANIDSDFTKYVRRSSLKKVIFMVTVPMFTVTAFLIALTGYASIISETGDLTFRIYEQDLNNLSIESSISDQDEVSYLKEKLKEIPLQKDSDFYFILTPDGTSIAQNNQELSIFFLKYLDEIAPTQPQPNRTYDFYGDDSQGIVRTVSINGQDWTIGIRYNLVSNSILVGLLFIFAVLFIVNIVILYNFSNYIINDINRVSKALLKISKNKNVDFNYKLPVISNDEIGDLVNAFNQIQTLTKNNIDQIHKNQDTLMERERLASLGQLIGGIAHNLKTPIMSISGAGEGLTYLIREYKESIQDPEVTVSDHLEIAQDMQNWVFKIKEYTEYMSDVITAVKGQAVSLSSDQNIQFNMDELLKRIDILMKHELKNALISLNIQNHVSNDIYLKGDVNSLVQVINNMISNSIQAYQGKTNETIELIVEKEDSKILISIKDHASGMTTEVKEKLFKEMITTKGKNGTGLGLFMSYSTVKAHFGGNILVDSQLGKGTTFIIVLPL